MGWKPWYEQLAEMNNEAEKREFMKGVFGGRKYGASGPIVAGLMAGYLVSKIATKKKKK